MIKRRLKGCILLALALLGINGILWAAPPRISVELGPQKTLLQSGRFGLEFFPDMAVTVIGQPPDFKLLVVAGIKTYLMEGADLEHIKKSNLVLKPGPLDSFENGYVGICGAYADADGKVYAVYHAEDQQGLPKINGGIPGFYCSVALASSSDGGRTWEKLGQLITSNKPKEWTAFQGQPDRGEGEPWIIVSKDGKYRYLYYTDHSRQGYRGVQICMARSPMNQPPTPGHWQKYCNGKFSEPGIGGNDTPVMSALAFNQADAMMPNVVYSEYLEKYIMTFNLDVWKEFVNNTGLKESGIYVAYSDDGIRWSEPEKLFMDYATALVGKSVSWHPSLVWDPNSHQEGWLVYGYSPRWGGSANNLTPHYMVGRRIKFVKNP